jgi:hypothetical protein
MAPRVFAAASAAFLLLATLAAVAQANRVQYNGQEVGNSRVLMGFVLQGQGCPRGPHCFDNATVRNFDAVSYKWTTCPELLDSAFEYSHPIRVKDDRSFRATGLSDFEGDRVYIRGRFFDDGRRARGFFKVVQAPFSDGCTTGWRRWSARPGG